MPKVASTFPGPDAYADLIRLAKQEDLRQGGDVTSRLTIAEDAMGTCTILQKQAGVVCGLPLIEPICRVFDDALKVTFSSPLAEMEGTYSSDRRRAVAGLAGPMRSILAAERTILNFLGKLSGIATLTRQYVEKVKDTTAGVYDTRKTTPGYRELSKYAVRAGGGFNHRMAMDDMVLVKDNHVAALQATSLRDAAEQLVQASRAEDADRPIEIEVDTFDQFRAIVDVRGLDVILLDNMDCPTMKRCVQLRDATGTSPALEASGGVTLETIAEISRTGVDRIAVGAITHSAVNLDLGLDYGDA